MSNRPPQASKTADGPTRLTNIRIVRLILVIISHDDTPCRFGKRLAFARQIWDIGAIVIARRKVVISLAINFSVQWAVSLLFWMGRFHARAMVIWLAPAAPPYYGTIFLAERDLDVALASLIVTVLAIVLCLLAVLKRRIATLIPAHIMLVVYWFWSYCLIGIGV